MAHEPNIEQLRLQCNIEAARTSNTDFETTGRDLDCILQTFHTDAHRAIHAMHLLSGLVKDM